MTPKHSAAGEILIFSPFTMVFSSARFSVRGTVFHLPGVSLLPVSLSHVAISTRALCTRSCSSSEERIVILAVKR